MLFSRILSTCLTLTILGVATQAVQAQTNKTAAPPAEVPTKIGIIDMGYLFNNYQKFIDKREILKVEIQKTDEAAKAMVEQAQGLAKQLQGDTIKKGSPDYEKIEAQVIKIQTDLNVMKQKSQRDFMKKETDIYKEVYLEVSETVEKYAQFYKYSMIIRFSRDKVEESDDPRQLLQNMNNQVIYFNPNTDITEQVLKYLNDRYTPNRPANTTATAPGSTVPR